MRHRDYEDNPLSANELAVLKYALENDAMLFFRYFYKAKAGMPAVINWHHLFIQYVLNLVMLGQVTRLIINCPPGYNKTEIAVINFIARGLALYPRSRYIHTSYSNDLALANSSKIKDTIELPEYQELWPTELRVDSKSKKSWNTEAGGGMVATATGGAVTGFRAGRMERGFSGAVIVDDPLKPDAAYSDVLRNKANNQFPNTLRSRLAVEDVPIIVIMQRLHPDDITGFLLGGGTGDKWHHLILPASIPRDWSSIKYPKEYTHGIEIYLAAILKGLRS